MKKVISIAIVIICLFSLAACGSKADTPDLWKDALYQEDTTLGEGAKTLVVEVTAAEKTVTFTVKTDKDTVGAALLEQNLIAGDQGEFGLYIKKVNGITADYDIDQTYWAFSINGEYATAGISDTPIAADTIYGLTLTKG